jgi:group II intron maturase
MPTRYGCTLTRICPGFRTPIRIDFSSWLFNVTVPGGALLTRRDPVQRPGSRTDAAASGRQPGEDDRRLNPFVRGWAGYFGFSQWRELPSLDGWIRRRLRCVVWVQWKTRGQRYRELRRLKVPERSASAAIFSPKGPWRLSFSEALHRAFTKARFSRLGLISMEKLASA